MRETDQIELREEPVSAIGNHRVWIERTPTATLIPESLVEASVACAQGWLLFADDNPGFEELVSIYFFDHSKMLRDKAYVGAPYASGCFGNFTILSPNAVSFTFVEDTPWIVRLLDAPKLALPFLPGKLGIWRGANWRRHFEVERGAVPSAVAASPAFSHPFVARPSRRRPDARRGLSGGEGVVDTTSSRHEGAARIRASVSAAAVEGV